MTKKKQGIIILILAAVLFLIYGYWNAYSIYNKGKHLNENLGYAVGIYGGRTPSGGTMRGSSTGNNVFFSYVVDDKLIMDVKTLAVESQNEGGIIADKYLVIYDTTNLEHAAILFNYPIKDSLSYLRYIEGFKEKPLNITPYFRLKMVSFFKDYSQTNK